MSINLDKLTMVHDEKNHRFIIPLEKDEAWADYIIIGERIILTHLEVPHPFERKGIGGKLTRLILEYSKANNLKVISLCSYISRFISRHPEFKPLEEVMD